MRSIGIPSSGHGWWGLKLFIQRIKPPYDAMRTHETMFTIRRRVRDTRLTPWETENASARSSSL
jgi:hypothetical protein